MTIRTDGHAGVRALYLRLYDRLFARPGLVIGAVALAAAGASLLVPRIGLDMSFRPLFGQSERELEATRAFEARFGQRSGAYVGAIVTPESWTPALLEGIAAASAEVERLDHVVEVVSVARVPAVEWRDGSPRVGWVLEPTALDSVSEAELDAALALRDAPDFERTLFSGDARRTLLLARLDLPIEDLERRAPVIRAFREVVSEHVGRDAELKWVGISVVEEAYSRLVLGGIARSLVLTTLALLLVLGAVFRRAAAVGAIMAGVCLALPVALAVMVVRGQAITIVNSMVPTMIMIIGVADAIHMFECYSGHVAGGKSRPEAVRSMFGDMALPCLLTALTTAAGFLALEVARIAAIRDFGLNVAVGVSAVYVANLLALPALLLILPERRLLAPRRSGSGSLAAWHRFTVGLVTRRPGGVVAGAAALIVVSALGVQRLDVDQRFNEDVAEDHPVRVAQDAFERDFTGVLGPDVTVRRLDGTHVLHGSDRRRLGRFADSVRVLPGVIHVASVLDWLPEEVGETQALSGLHSLRKDPRVGRRVRDVITGDGRQAAVVVGVADVGSSASLELAEEIRRIAARDFGPGYEVEVVGQWWLAQLGLSNIVRDMLVSFATSFALVLPLLAIALASVRLFLVALVPNLLPMFFALGFMGWTGISARVGTAMILAIALAIAVDDTIHILVRLKEAKGDGTDPEGDVRSAIERAGGPVLLTTVVLVAGFLSMRANGLLALQDMGLVAAATLVVALLADVYLLPASYLLIERRLARRPTAT